MRHLHAIRYQRKKWALSQEELADLLSISRTTLTRLEIETETSRLETMLALLVVFGLEASTLLPRTFARVKEAVMKRAAKLDARLRSKTDAKSLRKLHLLSDMVKRATARINRI